MMTFGEIAALDHVFDAVVGSARRAKGDAATFRVPSEVREQKDAYILQFDVPGVKVDDLDITLENLVLNVRGERRHPADGHPADLTGTTRRRNAGLFSLSYELPASIDPDSLSADLAEGVLTVRVPKRPNAQARRVMVVSGPSRKPSAD